MSRPRGQSPDSDVRHVLVDGDNLLHRVRGSRDDAGLRWLLPRLRAWRPPGVDITIVLDGHPPTGEGIRQRVERGVGFVHSGSRTADSALAALLTARPYADRAVTVVVSDDRGVLDHARRAGGLARRLDWLVGQLAASASPSGSPARAVGIGQGARASRAASRSRGEGDGDGESHGHGAPGGWSPGRGATRKRGNPKRGHPGGQPGASRGRHQRRRDGPTS